MINQCIAGFLSIAVVGCSTIQSTTSRYNRPMPCALPHYETKELFSQISFLSEERAPTNSSHTRGKSIEAHKQHQLTLAELAKKYPDVFKLHGSLAEKKVAFTFDDGPDNKYTPQILDILKAHGVQATFFITGQHAETYPDIVKRMVNEGHAVGNHSYSHPLLTKLKLASFESQIMSTQSILENLTGQAPTLFRPPYGAINEEQLKWAQMHHLLIVNWNVDSLDWKNLNEAAVYNNITKEAIPGSIILQHCAGGVNEDLSGTVNALPKLIDRFRADGYSLVTVPELLQRGGN